MDAFEDIIAGLFRQQGYWTRLSYKVDLSKEEKVAIDKPSSPRPEIDILAYKPTVNELLWIECKSYLDSYGVRFESFNGQEAKGADRYKVFTRDFYREVVTRRLVEQLMQESLVLDGVTVKYGLVAGRVYPKSRVALKQHFDERGWLLFDDTWIKDKLRDLAKLGYENDVAIIVAKLFERTS